MAENKMDIHPSEGKLKAENILVQVTIILLTKDNYLTWSIAITIGILGRGKYDYMAGSVQPLTRADPSCEIWFLEDNQVKM